MFGMDEESGAVAGIALVTMLTAFAAIGGAQEQGQGQAVITVLPKHESELRRMSLIRTWP